MFRGVFYSRAASIFLHERFRQKIANNSIIDDDENDYWYGTLFYKNQ